MGELTKTLFVGQRGETAQERIGSWSQIMGVTGTAHIAESAAASFKGEFHSRQVGEILVVRIRSSSFRFLRTLRAEDTLTNHLFVNVVVEGGMHGVVSGRKVNLLPGSVITTRSSGTFDLMIEDAEWLGIVFPLAAIERYGIWSAAHDGRHHTPDSLQAVLLGAQAKALLGMPGRLAFADAHRASRIAIRLVADCLSTSERSTARADDEIRRMVRHFILDQIENPRLSVDLVCRELGLSRPRLYRAMKDGAEIASFIRRMRLMRAREEIVSIGALPRSLAAIGAKWGFCQERSFRRAFLKEFGLSPSALRARSGGEPKQSFLDDSLHLSQWFRTAF